MPQATNEAPAENPTLLSSKIKKTYTTIYTLRHGPSSCNGAARERAKWRAPPRLQRRTLALINQRRRKETSGRRNPESTRESSLATLYDNQNNIQVMAFHFTSFHRRGLRRSTLTHKPTRSASCSGTMQAFAPKLSKNAP